MHVLMRSQHDNKLVCLHWAVTQTDWHEKLLRMLVDQCEKRLKIRDESFKARFWQINDKDLMILG